MSSDQVCRICLSVDVRMISLVPLKDVYEKVTNFRLQADKKPITACYVCVAELKRCFKFITKSVQAEDMMETLLKTQSDITPKSVAVVDREARGLCHSYQVTPVKHESFDSEYLVVVKSEPLLEEEIHVKEEGDPLTENMAVSEGEDDNSEDDIPLGSIQQVKGRGAPGSSQAQADVQSDSEQPPLPLEVNIKVEDNDSDDDATQSNEKQGAMPSGTQIGTEPYKARASFACHLCGLNLSDLLQMTRHIKIHHSRVAPKNGAKITKIDQSRTRLPFRCTHCRVGFNVLSELSKHIRQAKGYYSKFEMFECAKCSLHFISFPDIEAVKRHMMKHTGRQPVDITIKYD